MTGWAILAVGAALAAVLLYACRVERRRRRERRDREWWGRGR